MHITFPRFVMLRHKANIVFSATEIITVTTKFNINQIAVIAQSECYMMALNTIIMTLKEFVKETFEEKHGHCHRPKIVCNDGFEMSVQGSAGHYCSPRETQDWYNEMEIGYPSEKEESIMEYAEQEDRPTNTVYGYVPCFIIQEIIKKHGGIDVDKTLKRNV